MPGGNGIGSGSLGGSDGSAWAVAGTASDAASSSAAVTVFMAAVVAAHHLHLAVEVVYRRAVQVVVGVCPGLGRTAAGDPNARPLH